MQPGEIRCRPVKYTAKLRYEQSSYFTEQADRIMDSVFHRAGPYFLSFTVFE